MNHFHIKPFSIKFDVYYYSTTISTIQLLLQYKIIRYV